ncbi:MAG: TetR/AcrR family transcriptional regulator [Rhodospirillales bacterium]|nr:TetR/AcrR family transcriptional regulator [Rhodospirillales bacterium]
MAHPAPLAEEPRSLLDTDSFGMALYLDAGKPKLRKTARTRLRLLAATADILNAKDDVAALRVTEVVRRAGIAHGTFYRYYDGVPAIVEEAIAVFAEFQRDRLGAVRAGAAGSRERVRATTLAYIRIFRANAGMMRCLMGLGADSAHYRARFHELNRDWNRRVAQAIAANRSDASAESLLPTAYALGGMIDEFLAQLYLRRDPALAALAEDPDAVADLLSELWCRGAYGTLQAS